MVFQILSSSEDFFSCVLFVFWTSLSESTCRRLLLEQYFSFSVPSKFLTNWMIIHSSVFFSDIYFMIAYDYHTFTWLLWCIFCIWSLYFNYGKKRNNQINKGIKQSLHWPKNLSKKKKKQLKNTFYIIKLTFSVDFGGK